MIQASCLCGAVDFNIHAELTDLSLCHCIICRKNSGAAFSAYGSFSATDIVWKQGEGLLKTYIVNDTISKMFCSQCGSTVLTRHKLEPDFLHVSLGVVDNDENLKLEYHQYTNSKAGWFDIKDDLAKFPAWPD